MPDGANRPNADQSPESLTNDAELEDVEQQPGFDLGRIDLSLLGSPVVVRAMAGIAVASLILAWPQRTDRILARLIGLALIALGTTSMWNAVRSRPRLWLTAVLALAGSLLGVTLLVSPDRSEVLLARLIGGVLTAVAVRDLISLRGGHTTESRSWIISRSLATLGAGTLLLAFPAEVFATATTLAALGWIAMSLLVIMISLDARTTGVTDYAESTRLIGAWLDERPKSVDDRQALYDKILFEGPATTRRIVRFFTLMGFASVIASMGVITDSTAVVIGAMLIAPLMTPLMAMAISLVMGWPRRLSRATLVAAGGIVFAIAVGVVIGLLVPSVIDTTANSQIAARSSPTMLDLITAVAAGSAGAYGLSRPDVSDSLPGVAIAISLVPPLSVVGIAYSQGDWQAGHGALLLFLTNMLAILIMGGLTFIVTGVTPVRRVAENQHRVRSSLAAVAALAAAVLGALLLNGTEVATNVLEQSSAEDTIADWLDEHPDYSVVRVTLGEQTVTATIVGPSTDPPSAESLAPRLRAALGRPVTADIRLIIEERDVATAD